MARFLPDTGHCLWRCLFRGGPLVQQSCGPLETDFIQLGWPDKSFAETFRIRCITLCKFTAWYDFKPKHNTFQLPVIIDLYNLFWISVPLCPICPCPYLLMIWNPSASSCPHGMGWLNSLSLNVSWLDHCVFVACICVWIKSPLLSVHASTEYII